MISRIFIPVFFLLVLSCTQVQKTPSVPAAIEQNVRESKTSEKNALVDSLQLSYVMGKFSPESDSSFTLIPSEFADKSGMYLRKEAYKSFLRMYEAAKAEGINLQIRSATRNFDYQKGIWERKWTGETILSSGEDASKAYSDEKERALSILKYSSMPGTSRHHWGTDIDLNNFNNSWFEEGEGLVLFDWLEAHAHEYGYCRPYTAKNALRPDGYNEEKWHWSYLPLDSKLTGAAEKHLEDKMLRGFQGSEVAEDIGVVEKYVLGINSNCNH